MSNPITVKAVTRSVELDTEEWSLGRATVTFTLELADEAQQTRLQELLMGSGLTPGLSSPYLRMTLEEGEQFDYRPGSRNTLLGEVLGR